MVSLPLKFDEVESVEEFVNMVKRVDYNVDVKVGRCVFDAKWKENRESCLHE